MPEFIKERVRNLNDRLFNTSVVSPHQAKLHKKEDQLRDANLRVEQLEHQLGITNPLKLKKPSGPLLSASKSSSSQPNAKKPTVRK